MRALRVIFDARFARICRSIRTFYFIPFLVFTWVVGNALQVDLLANVFLSEYSVVESIFGLKLFSFSEF